MASIPFAVCLGVGVALANPYTEVASAFDDGDSFDLHVWIDYAFELHRAEIKRESAGLLSDTQPEDPLPVVKDLLYSSSRHVVVPRLSLGVFTDLSLGVALPIVVGDSRLIELDQRIEPIVDRTNSTTILDGLLPQNGFDSDDPTGGFSGGQTELFRGPTRSGLDQLHLGLTWAPMNQARDDTKPTWQLGAEVRVAIGRPMRFDRLDPGAETSVGRGIHEVRLWTSFAKRVGWAEPYVELWWMAPLATTGDSPFDDLGFGQNRAEPQQQAGTRFGFEAIAWEDPVEKQRLGLNLTARVDARFEGRDYTQMWEVLQFAGDARIEDAPPPLVLDADPTMGGVQALSHPGVSNVENYLRFGGRFGVEAMLSERIRLGASVEIIAAQNHVITFADAGVDKPTCGDGVTTDCETDDNGLVNPGTDEVNPTHVEAIDLVGRRYRVEEGFDYLFSAAARILF